MEPFGGAFVYRIMLGSVERDQLSESGKRLACKFLNLHDNAAPIG